MWTPVYHRRGFGRQELMLTSVKTEGLPLMSFMKLSVMFRYRRIAHGVKLSMGKNISKYASWQLCKIMVTNK
jgi:hypothetical protein